MRSLGSLQAFCLFAVLSQTADILVSAQAFADSAYAPTVGACPSDTQLVRTVGASADKQTLSAGEAQYISDRSTHVLPTAWAEYLKTVEKHNAGLALPSYVGDILVGKKSAHPTLGIATSGGGHRAAIFGAGILGALDGRNASSVAAGTGGLLQAATYLSGLSGGSWLVGSLVQSNFPTLPSDLVFGLPSTSSLEEEDIWAGWLTQFDLLAPGDSLQQTGYELNVLTEVGFKRTEGFPVSVTDVWARALSRHFVNGTTSANFFDDATLKHGAGITLSSLTNLTTFVDHTQPFPILVANSLTSRSNGTAVIEPGNVIPLMNPIYEFNVFETGSFDPALGAFTPTKFLGTTPGSNNCVTGFDQVAFIQGTSSNLFNEYNTSAAALQASPVGEIVTALEVLYPQTNVRLDSSQIPNPFVGVSSSTFPDSDQELLTMVDGGEDGEVIPIQPLLVKARAVDTIIAIDAAADTADNWADGSSIIATQDRVKLFTSTYAFPSVPSSAADFLAQNLTTRPTFFGCNSTASSAEPLVIYLANGGAPLGEAPLTNTNTSQTEYALDEVQSMLNQVLDVATQGFASGSEKDPLWPACLACAVVDRARRDAGVERSGVCTSCLNRYCWS